MTQFENDLKFPDRKISETFLNFAEPMLNGLGPSATNAQMNEVLKIAFVVWNSVVYDTVNGTTLVDQIRQSTAHDPEMAAFMDRLISRKHNMFADDYRLIGEYKLTYKNDELTLRAEGRDPRRKK